MNSFVARALFWPVRVTIRWSALLAVSLFWIWAVNGYPAGSRYDGWILNITLVAFFAYFAFNYWNPRFATALEFNFSPAIILLFAGLLIVLRKQLTQELWSDQIYHASLSVRHAQLMVFLIEQKFPALWQIVEDFPANTFIRAVNAVFLLLLVLLFWVLPRLLKNAPYIAATLLTLALLLFRWILSSDENIFAGLDSPVLFGTYYSFDLHPLLRLGPLFVSSTIIGVSELGFRIAAFAFYLAFLLCIFNLLVRRATLVMAVLAVAAIGSIPIFLHVSYLVEQSIWSALGASAIFAILYSTESEDIQPLPLVAIALLAAMLRAPGFLAMIPAAIIVAFQLVNRRLARDEFVRLAVLGLFFLLIFVVVGSRGSPATTDGGVLGHALQAAIDNVPAIATATLVGMFPLFLVGFALRGQSAYRMALAGGVLAFSAACWLVYYGPVVTQLWGTSRYQAEMITPLIVAGVFAMVVDASRAGSETLIPSIKGDRLRLVMPAILLVALVAVNLFTLATHRQKSLRPLNAPPPPGETFLAEIEYPTRQAFDFVAQQGWRRNTFFVGIYYGGFATALRGYSLDDYSQFSRLNTLHRANFASMAGDLNSDASVKAVLVEPEEGGAVIAGLRALAWKEHEFIHPRSKRKILVLTRT